MTEHRCVVGGWQPGRAANCSACKAGDSSKRKIKVKGRLES